MNNKLINPKKMYHEDLNILHLNCEEPRSYFIPFETKESASKYERSNSELFFNLCGQWKFKFYQSYADVLDDFYATDYNIDELDDITVPKCWQMYTDRDYDKPNYINQEYPFHFDPPYVPDENPCGAYIKDFHIDDINNVDTFINFEGVSSAFYLYINGKFVGYSQVTHNTSELNVSKYLIQGRNRIAVLVLKWCDGSYLEDQDYFRLNGIFRDVYILKRQKNHLKDYYVKVDIDSDLKTAKLDIDFIKQGEFSVDYSMYSPSGDLVAKGRVDTDNLQIAIDNPTLWNVEDPQLYSLFFEYEGEAIKEKLALRRLNIDDGVVYMNNVAVKLYGVNRHDIHQELGYTTPPLHMKNDLYMLKQGNCNAIRTSHYPNDPRFLNYCDELGFLIINEADLETHGAGFEFVGDSRKGAWSYERWSFFSESPDWAQAYIDRAKRLFERDKNRGSIVMWSLGNESGVGVNHSAMTQYIKSRMPDAIVHYENAHSEFVDIPEGADYSDISDVESRMYANIEKIDAYCSKAESTKPFYLCEYLSANITGNIYANVDLIDKHPKFFGACIWEITDHAVSDVSDKGKIKFGGDFGDYPHDKYNCLDGIVYPDRVPKPGYYDMKKAYQQVTATYNQNILTIKNKRFYTGISDIDVYWSVECDGEIILDGRITNPDISPREERDFKLYDTASFSGITYLSVRFVYNCEKYFAPLGYEAGFEQFKLSEEIANIYKDCCKELNIIEENRYLTIKAGQNTYKFDKIYGKLISIINCSKEMITSPIEFSISRPTTNGSAGNEYWKLVRFDHAYQKTHSFEYEQSNDEVIITCKIGIGPPSSPFTISGVVTYTVTKEGAVYINFIGDVREVFKILPKIGLKFNMSQDNENITYYGYGPFETYVDKYRAARIGKFETTVTDNFEHYINPQENGSHYNTYWAMVFNDNGHGLFFAPTGQNGFLCFNASHYSQKMVDSSLHDYDLVPIEETIINLDYRHNAMSASETIAKLEPWRDFDDKHIEFAFKIMPIYHSEVEPFDVI